MPDIGKVTRQLAGRDEDGVDPDVVVLPRVARGQPLGGHGHPPQPIFIERQCQPLLAAACLDLDKGQGLAAPRDEVDFAARNAGPAGEDAPAVQSQPPGRLPFGAAAALLGKDTPVQRLSSSARA